MKKLLKGLMVTNSIFSKAILLTRSDQLFEAKNGDCILFSANENINIKPTDSDLEVLHLSFKSADFSKFLSSLDYQTNSLQTPIQTYFIDNITDKIAIENTLKDLHYESIISILIEELLPKYQDLLNKTSCSLCQTMHKSLENLERSS